MRLRTGPTTALILSTALLLTACSDGESVNQPEAKGLTKVSFAPHADVVERPWSDIDHVHGIVERKNNSEADMR